jgi:hypothetical protein
MPVRTTTAAFHLAPEQVDAPSTRARVLLAVAVLLGLLAAWSNSEAEQPVNVAERSYNPLRTGANTLETILTPQMLGRRRTSSTNASS